MKNIKILLRVILVTPLLPLLYPFACISYSLFFIFTLIAIVNLLSWPFAVLSKNYDHYAYMESLEFLFIPFVLPFIQYYDYVTTGEYTNFEGEKV